MGKLLLLLMTLDNADSLLESVALDNVNRIYNYKKILDDPRCCESPTKLLNILLIIFIF